MTTISVRVPMRADLAGGTLDLWPLYLFHRGARTVNVAVSCFAECIVQSGEDESIELLLADQGYHRRYATIAELSADPKAALIATAIEHFRISGVRIETRSGAPRGSGLGGSSALGIALVRALSELVGQPVEGEELIALVRDLETRLLRSPAGIQDYYPPVYGGLASLHLEAGGPRRVPIRFSLADLATHFVLHYSDVAHFSGTNNWEIYRRAIDGDRNVHEGLSNISRAAQELERALEDRDIERAAEAMSDEWNSRKRLIRGVSTPEVDAVIDAAVKAGAWGGKVCGAGGGGCVVFLVPPERRAAVLDALESAPGRTLGALPVTSGLEIDFGNDRASSWAFAGRRGADSDVTEQLFMSSEEAGIYQPWLLAEVDVNYDLPRGGLHWSETRILLAPINWLDGNVDWSVAYDVVLERLRSTRAPLSNRALVVSPEAQGFIEALRTADESLRLHLCERERTVVFHNPSFDSWSLAHESKESFRQRCLELARQQLDEETKRLETVFRRRMDQLKEKQAKEELDRADEPEAALARSSDEVNIAWGQMIYNITTGKSGRTIEPQSLREIDYLHRIGEMQRQWEREREALLDTLTESARAIEEIAIEPEPRTIAIQRLRILWGSRSEITAWTTESS
ncbi:MAG TPA: hypothetical protein VMT00_07490 [Thermoanaerobaculia bacterium]|nr:hypothetical protein [Thermoanaerobaculia bacterium]